MNIKTQRGLALAPFLFGAVVLIIVVIMGLRMIPAYMQNAKIVNVFNAIKHDPDMANANLDQMRASFAKRATIDTITAITPEKIEQTDGGVLIAHYTVILPLIGNASLMLEFTPRSAQ